MGNNGEAASSDAKAAEAGGGGGAAAAWDLTFTTYVRLEVRDREVMARAATDAWRKTFHAFAVGKEEEGAVEMLARNMAIDGYEVNDTDGWADVDPADVAVESELVLEEVVEATPEVDWDADDSEEGGIGIPPYGGHAVG